MFSIAAITVIFIIAYVMFNDSPEVNIYQITTETTVYYTIPESERLDINEATKEELMKLNGIGDVLSDRIIDYRDKNGSFRYLEELKNIKGITKSLYDKILPYIKITDP